MRGAASVTFGNTVLTFNSLIVGDNETRILPCVGDVLRVLSNNRNTFVSVKMIRDAIYPLNADAGPDYDSFSVLVSHARKALMSVGSDSTIENQRSRGYKLACRKLEDSDVRLRLTSVQYAALQMIVRYSRSDHPRLAALVAAAVETPQVGLEVGRE